MDFYVAEINCTNQTKFKRNDIFCGVCNELLNGNIFTCDEKNICESCLEGIDAEEQKLYQSNSFLRKQLEATQFPCQFERCTFADTISALCTHYKFCSLGPILCPVDRESFEPVGYLEHLSTHERVEKLTPISLKITLTLDFTAEKRIMLVDYKVGKRLIMPCPTLKNFIVVHQNGNMQIRLAGKMLSFQRLFGTGDGGSKDILLNMSLLSAERKVTIHFSDMDSSSFKLDDCSVCFAPLLDMIKMCRHGHMVCAKCASKITTCTICRVHLSEPQVNISQILSKTVLSCMNLDKGCLDLQNSWNERLRHNEVCAFRLNACPKCTSRLMAYQFTVHFKNTHETYPNFSMFQWDVNTNERFSAYIFYKSQIFCIKMRYNDLTLELKCKAEQLNGDEENASKFRYEVLVMNRKNAVIAKASNICMASDCTHVKPVNRGYVLPTSQSDTEKYNCTISLDHWFANDFKKLRCQYIIMYNYC